MADQEPRSLIQAACWALFAPGQVVELRILGIGRRAGHTASGWFNDYAALCEAALRYESQRAPEGVYVTLNPVHEACLARSPNAVREWVKTTTSDKDILRRHWLPVDIDPVRPSGVSSTDAELEAAKAVARSVAAWLEGEFGFPPGVRACSGNGVHLLYRVDVANDDEGKKTVAACLAALSGKFTSDSVLVDRSNVNAARIWKLYGTVARKGEALPDRPHRRSSLFTTHGEYPVFDQVGTVPADRLEALAGLGRPLLPSAAPARRRRKTAKASKPLPPISTEYAVDLDGFIAEHNIAVVREESFDGTGKRYILAACLFDSSHTGTSACLGRSNDGKIFYRCFHDSCSGNDWRAVKALYKSAGKGEGAATASAVVCSAGGEDVDPWALAKQLIADEWTDADTGQVLVRRHREQFYRYSHRLHCYRPMDRDTVNVSVTRWLGGRVEKTTKKLGADVTNCLEAILTAPAEIEIPFVSRLDAESGYSSGDPAKRHWVTLRNGILDVEAAIGGADIAACLHAHSPEWFSTNALPFPFPLDGEQAACPTWEAFLGQIFQGDQPRIDLLQEAFGMCFLNSTEYETFFVFHGVGRNGKSTALHVLRALLGADNVSSLSMEQLTDRYLVKELHGRLANICPDMNEMDRVQEGMLKAVVSGDVISADRKYKDPIQFRPQTKLFFATNVLPRFTDTSLGIWRRMILVPFDYVVPVREMDIYLFNKLEAELPGIFLWALRGLVRLKGAGEFSVSKKAETAISDYKLRCFPIMMFLDECCVDDGQTTARKLWGAYRKWCESVGLTKPKPFHAFLQDVLGFKLHVQHSRPNPARYEGYMDLYGLSLREDIASLVPGLAEPVTAYDV